MKVWPVALCLLVACASAHAKPSVWQPTAGHKQIPIWPRAVPDVQPVPGPETVTTRAAHLIANKPWMAATHVTRPTMTVYAPKSKNTGTAMVVFPGGGFEVLAMDLEGTEPCHWLTSNGITCVLLKYRVPSAPYDWHCKCRPDDFVTLVVALAKAHVPTEMHLYAHGGHAFELRRTKFPITRWPSVATLWPTTIGMIP